MIKDLFPLNTFHQDAVLKRLNDLLDNDKELDDKMPYDEDTDTFSIDGDLAVDGDLSVGDIDSNGIITGDEIVENMSGYSAELLTEYVGLDIEVVYVGVVKNGNKITFVSAFNITRTDASATDNPTVIRFTIPQEIGAKLYNTQVGIYSFLDNRIINAWSAFNDAKQLVSYMDKIDATHIVVVPNSITSLTLNTKYYYRYEATFLLSDNLISES